MAEKVKLSKDGSSIDFVQSESLPTSVKKFRQSPEIEGFYRFIFENDLQKEAYEILNRIIEDRKLKKAQMKKEAKEAARMEKNLAAEQAKKVKTVKAEPKTTTTKLVKAAAKPAVAAKPAAPVKAAAKPAAKAAAPSKSAKPAAKSAPAAAKNGKKPTPKKK